MSDGISLKSLVVASKENVSCSLGDEAAILHMKSGVYYGLDPVGARVWSMLLEPRTVEELRETIGLAGDPIFTRVYRWPRSMAQYMVGHQDRVSAIEVRLRLHHGLHLSGNAYHGIGIPDCVRMGRQVAESLAN